MSNQQDFRFVTMKALNLVALLLVMALLGYGTGRLHQQLISEPTVNEARSAVAGAVEIMYRYSAYLEKVQARDNSILAHLGWNEMPDLVDAASEYYGDAAAMGGSDDELLE